MSESRSTDQPLQPHDRLWAEYAKVYEGFEAIEEEIDALVEAGVMDGDRAQGFSANEWQERLDDLKGWASQLLEKIDNSVDSNTGSLASRCESDSTRAPRVASSRWREAVNRARRSAAGKAGGAPAPAGGS